MWTRRDILQRGGLGLGWIGALHLLSPAAAQTEATNQFSPFAMRSPHFPGKAKRVIHLFMNGGVSHIDSFDPKPTLAQYHGKTIPSSQKTERKTGAAFASPFVFQHHGKSGIEVSDLFPHISQSADELCVLRSMHTDVPNHEPSYLMMNCGDARQPRPAMGSWITYGLGSENQNLPGFIVMCPAGQPSTGANNWRSAFLPGAFQGTYIDSQHSDPLKLVENIRNPFLRPGRQRAQLDLLQKINQRHLAEHGRDSLTEARLESFELAFRMQSEATDAFDVSREPQAVREMYGETTYGRQVLIGRRLLERGVRFVQIWQRPGQPWDAHDQLEKNHRELALECDQPIGALLKDLKARGMLDDTLVIWGGEFGRTPTVEIPTPGVSSIGQGRDHNHYGFSMWLAGGGVKRGYIHGATDDLGWNAVEQRMHIHDLHATILHLLGFDHEKLTYRYAGRDYRLTDVHGHVVHDILA